MCAFVFVCVHAHICMGWRDSLGEGCLLSYPVFYHIQTALSQSTTSTETPPHQIPLPSAKMDQPPSRTALKFPTTATFPYCLLISEHTQKVLKLGTSLVAQWLRIHLPMQGTQVRSHMPWSN